MKEILKDIFIGILVMAGFIIGTMLIYAIFYSLFGGLWNVFFGM